MALLVCAGVCMAGAAPVVVELFTSEGCSSCPPADELLARLARQPIAGVEVIALSEHVDYWNHLGWADPFSSAAYSDRQNGYAHLFRVDSVYTPQMVINGQAQLLGSDEAEAYSLIKRLAARPKAAVSVTTHGIEAGDHGHTVRVAVRVEALEALSREPVDVVLAVTETGLLSDVLRGENAGRRLRHTGVVRSLAKIAELDPRDPKKAAGYTGDMRVALDKSWHEQGLKIVVFAQEHNNRRVLGAGTCRVSGD